MGEARVEDWLGESVRTVFGPGTVTSYRPDGCFKIKLEFGAVLYTVSGDCILEKLSSNNNKTTAKTSASNNSVIMDLNIAYEALEDMRKMNLEVQCADMGIVCDHECCTMCLLESGEAPSDLSNSKSSSFSWRTRKPKQRKPLKANGRQCLICASPTCNALHSSAEFKKERITVCLQCEEMFHLEFDSVTVADKTKLANQMRRMVDAYDRCLLLLRYSSQLVDDLAQRLHSNEARNNRICFGTSTGNFVSGALSIAGAATLLTPVGPHLILASLLFNCSSTAVQAGHEALNLWNDHEKIANRILALHGMAIAIVKSISVLRLFLMEDVFMLDNKLCDAGRVTGRNKNNNVVVETLSSSVKATRYTTTSVKVGTAAGSVAGYNAATSTVLSANATATAAASSNLLASTVKVIPILGSTYSAAMMCLDATTMTRTIANIHRGHPCEKAQELKAIKQELDQLPKTVDLEMECKRCLDTAKIRQDMMDRMECNDDSFRGEEKKEIE